MKKKYNYAVFIGRLQPPHKEHINQIKHGLDLADRVIIALGSHRAAPNIKNPWTSEEREQMVLSCFDLTDRERLIFLPIRDYKYNNTQWFTQLHNSVLSAVDRLDDRESATICVVGSNKDSSSWYLDALPENWKRELSAPRDLMHATNVRDLYFQKDPSFSKDLPKEVAAFLINKMSEEQFENLAAEWRFIKEYKAMWAMAPYPVTFVTTDVLVVKNGHILVIRRKFNPGKGLLALPGGFIDQNENIIDSAFRELKEETRILVPKDVLMKHVVDERVFDHPSRSLRGRTITHAFCVKLPDGGSLPKIKSGDDAEKAIWMPIADLFIKEHEFYEDHCHIINHFTSKL